MMIDGWVAEQAPSQYWMGPRSGGTWSPDDDDDDENYDGDGDEDVQLMIARN